MHLVLQAFADLAQGFDRIQLSGQNRSGPLFISLHQAGHGIVRRHAIPAFYETGETTAKRLAAAFAQGQGQAISHQFPGRGLPFQSLGVTSKGRTTAPGVGQTERQIPP
jgi:hypothetical protein